MDKQSIWRRNRKLMGHEAPEWLHVCEYPNCQRVTEYKAEGKTPLCSEHNSMYIFMKDHFEMKKDE